MEYRELGKTGLRTSVIGFGSVELGMDYGIKVPGDGGRPDRETAMRLIDHALDQGINLIDTAPAYGDSEELLGSVIGSRACYIATKVSPLSGQTVTSVEKSLRSLRRECIDIVQIHNATVDTIRKSDVAEHLINLRQKGLIRFIGASVYGFEDAMAVIDSGDFDVLQIAYNILDRDMANKIIPEARKNGIGVFGRSVYLKGVLTSKVEHLSDEFVCLKNAVNDIKDKLNIDNYDLLAEIAFRFCMSNADIATVLVGTRSIKHLQFAIDAEKKGVLPEEIFEQLLDINVDDRYWLDPRNWPMS